MFSERVARTRAAYTAFLDTPLSSHLEAHIAADPRQAALALFQRTARGVPAYAAFLREQGVDPSTVRSFHNPSDTEDAVYVCVGGAGGYVGRDGLQPDG